MGVPAASFRTVAERLRFEPAKILGSRHIATVGPIASEDDLQELLATARADVSAANHHAFAYRLRGDAERFRSSDDGEPSGSAGRPILQQIDARELVDAAVVVSRIFGGTKLGVGGLMRAYGGAASEALDRASIIEVVVTETIEVEFDYGESSAMQAVLYAARLEPRDSAYGADVRLVVEVPVDRAGAFCRAVRDATSGRARLRRAADQPSPPGD